MKNNWEKLHPMDQCLLIVRIVVSVVVIVCAVLQIFEIWDKAIHVAAPLMGVVLLLQGVQEWKHRRGLAVFSLCCALFVFACAIAVWFL